MAKKHGKSHTRIHNIWIYMKQRCYNPKHSVFKYYGAKNIKICNEWLNNFESFYNWSIKNGYQDDLTIDRIDVTGDYCPENCRWISISEQQSNRRDTHFVVINGIKKTITEWSLLSGISRQTIRYRLQRHCPEEMLLRKGKFISDKTKEGFKHAG